MAKSQDTVEAVAAEWLTHLRVERGLSANTLDNYERDLRRYLQWLDTQGLEAVADIAPSHISAYVSDLRDSGLAESSARRALAVVRGLHGFAVKENYSTHNAAAETPMPRVPRALPVVLTIDEVDTLINAIPDGQAAKPLDLRDRALVELLYGTGARISEIVDLRIDDTASFDEGFVVLKGKGDKQRLVPVGGSARRAVDAYLTRGRPALSKGKTHQLFINQKGGALTRQSAHMVLARLGEKAGLSKAVSPHTLRHSYATHMLEGGAGVRVVQKLLGHSSATTTQIYTHVTVQALRESWQAAHPRAL